MPDLYDFRLKAVDGTEQSLGDDRGKVLLIARAGSVIARFDPSTAPTAPELRSVLQTALGS